MKNIILISNSDIVVKVFKLALQDEGYQLKIVQNIQDLSSCDMVLLDEEFINSGLNQVKQYTSNIGFISSDSSIELPQRVFHIPRPFLPSTLREIIKNNLLDIDLTLEEYEYETSEEDESIIDINSLQSLGGSLDKDELVSLKETLKKDHIQDGDISDSGFEDIEEDDLLELDKMIDQVICEIEDGTIDISEDGNMVVLSQHSVEQLKPLFSIINQDMVDQLSAGEIVDLKLKLKG